MNGDENAFNEAQRRYKKSLATIAAEAVIESALITEDGIELITRHGDHQVKSQHKGADRVWALQLLLESAVEIHARRQGKTYEAALNSVSRGEAWA